MNNCMAINMQFCICMCSYCVYEQECLLMCVDMYAHLCYCMSCAICVFVCARVCVCVYMCVYVCVCVHLSQSFIQRSLDPVCTLFLKKWLRLPQPTNPSVLFIEPVALAYHPW